MIDYSTLGYCSNVHAGNSIEEVKSNLERFAVPTREQFCPGQTMGIGLWLSDSSCQDLQSEDATLEFVEWLKERRLNAYTFNAFPFGDFHDAVVKHSVYRPDWTQECRLVYSQAIASLLSRIIDENQFGTISTLPLGWPSNPDESFFQKCAVNLVEMSAFLRRVKDETGRHIFLCIEPEPGCVIDDAMKLVDFFENYLFAADKTVAEFVGVCHDVCHSAVMFEPQASALQAYQKAGIHIGKYQISSAIRIDFEKYSSSEKREVVEYLEQFAEDRYLHQTKICSIELGQEELVEDLPIALSRFGENPKGEWRIHFHLPIYGERFGLIESTRTEIFECLKNIQPSALPYHFEIETYAWTVLPKSLRPASLTDGIVEELVFFRDHCLPMIPARSN